MNESGATAWEIRDLAKAITDDKIRLMDVRRSQYTTTITTEYVHYPYRDAILVEALNCLADKKEVERRVA